MRLLKGNNSFVMNDLDALEKQISQQSIRPVDQWRPAHVGEIDIFIDAQGQWFHEGDLIQREPLVKLFASILWYEQGQHYLVTPVEKLAIKVSDAPYIIQQADLIEDAWVVTTNTGEQVILDVENAVELRLYKDQWLPYINVRFDLWARVNRSVYYQWVTLAMDESEQPMPLVLRSQGYEFQVAKED